MGVRARSSYETNGLLPNVVFTCGTIVRAMRCGCTTARRQCVGLATASLHELVEFVQKYDFLCKIKPEKGMLS